MVKVKSVGKKPERRVGLTQKALKKHDAFDRRWCPKRENRAYLLEGDGRDSTEKRRTNGRREGDPQVLTGERGVKFEVVFEVSRFGFTTGVFGGAGCFGQAGLATKVEPGHGFGTLHGVHEYAGFL